MIKLFRFLKPYSLFVAAALLLIFLQTLADLVLPTLMSGIVDKGIMLGDMPLILKTGGLMLGIAALGVVCSVGAGFFATKTSMAFGRDVRSLLFSKQESFSLEEYDSFGASTLITRTTNDINQVQLVLLLILRMMVGAPLMGIGGIILAVQQEPGLSVILVAALPFLIALVVIIAFKGIPLFKTVQTRVDKLNHVLRENLEGIRVIRAFNRVEHEQNRFASANKDLMDNALRVNRLVAFMMPVLMLIMNFTMIAIVWFGGYRVDQGAMQIGSLMAFIQYAMLIMFSLFMLSFLFIMVPRAQASAERINEVLDKEPKIKDPLTPSILKGCKGHIRFDNVTFRFPGAEQPALCGVSFEAVPGQVTAIVGSTGAGKTALVSLVPRFYDVESGRVLLDDHDIRELRQEDLRGVLGFVPQKALLFTGSVSDNIRFGKEDASDDEVRKAAEIAQALDFIQENQEGFNTQIVQGGKNLSGGQKQRLAIARALVRKPKIFIFDDSFSALDFQTDAKLRSALLNETQEATVIIVAQRVATIMHADKIIVLDEGAVKGAGTHRELLATCQVYQEIVYSQLSKEELL